jgi:hypothetical protein
VFILWNEDRYPDSYIHEQLDRVAQGGSKHIAMPYFGCQTDLKSADVGSCEVTTEAHVERIVRLAQQHGFGVSLIPIVLTRDWQWRGFFEPTDVEGWFRTYTAWIRKIGALATRLGMQELVVGSEFSKLYGYGERWKQVLRNVRSSFAGPLIVTVNWGNFDYPFWEEADAIGVSAYYPLSPRVDPSQEELDQAWQARKQEFLALSRQWKRPIHVTEVGYTSTSNAARTPWDPGDDAKVDPALQARCFQAFRNAWANETALVRANVWATEPPAEYYSMSFDPIGKQAGEVLSRFFAERLTLH